MKCIKILSMLLVCLFSNSLHAQNTNQCVHCNMNIQDDLHRVSAEADSKTIHFRFGIEAGAPIYEDYNGIQMNESLTLNFGVKYNVL